MENKQWFNSLSEEDKETFKMFRKFVDSHKFPKYFDDYYISRFLKARKYDLVQAKTMFLNFLEFRKRYEVEQIESFVFHEMEDVKKFYPHGFHNTDKNGRPIYIERLGLLKVQQLFQITTEERLFKYMIQLYETLINKIFPSCKAQQLVVIIDLKGGQAKILSKQVYNLIQAVTKICQDNYPELLGQFDGLKSECSL